MEKIIFRNSERFINQGKDLGEGILYCGIRYTTSDGCPCGTCDGYCGLTNGCPCPDCDYTLEYILHSTGKMKCGKCNKDLIRLKLFDLKNIYTSKKIYNFRCDLCSRYFKDTLCIPLWHCMKCQYNICPKCAIAKIAPFEPKIPKVEAGFNEGIGMIYCRKNYANENFCLCGSCDGNCGEENGCPCPSCDAILGYNIYLKSNYMKCSQCNNTLRFKTTVGLLKKANIKILPCTMCSKKFKPGSEDYHVIYHCKKCTKNICKKCAYEMNIKGINNISFPKMPLFLDNMEKNTKEKIEKEKMNDIRISKQRNFRIIDKKVKGNNINVYIKTLIGRIYTVIIDENEDIEKLKEELGKLDKKLSPDSTIFIYKNKKLDNSEFLKDVGIENECLINVILK
jgi:hypothetical protein